MRASFPSRTSMLSPEKPKLSAEERRARQDDRLRSIRLRMAIGHELDDRGITDPVAIGEALGMPAKEKPPSLILLTKSPSYMAAHTAAGSRVAIVMQNRTNWPEHSRFSQP